MALFPSVVAIALCIIANCVMVTECSSYHVAFLGRTSINSNSIGSLLYPTMNPNPIISSAVENCTSSITPTSIAATSFTEVSLNAPSCEQLIPAGNEIQATGIKVESTADFILHVYQTGSANMMTKEGYLAIPDEHLGNEYYVVTYCTLGGFCQFAVVGIANETQVNIIFPDNVTTSMVCVNDVKVSTDAPPGFPVTFIIKENEVIHFESEHDLTGTYIFADNNVGVVSGARDVPTSQSGNTLSNLIEQLPPVMKWGYSFVAAPNYFNDAGDIVKIVTSSTDTIVGISGVSPFKLQNKGEFVEFRIDWQMHSHIESSKPILILQIMSVDLYNESSDVTGVPSMVLVPHVHQWTTADNPFYCLSSTTNQTLIAVVTDTDSSYSIPVIPTPNVFFSSWSVIEGTDFSVQIFEPITESTTVYGPARSSYGYCNGGSTLLLNADWSWSNQACVPSVVSPGDNVDNDCDGDIDEDNCIAEDLVTVFTSTQDEESGNVTYKTMTLHGTNYVKINIISCDVARIRLEIDKELPQTMNIEISISAIVVQLCGDFCLEAIVQAQSVSNCSAPQSYMLQWNNYLTLHTTTSTYTFYDNIPLANDYDKLMLSALGKSATFEIFLPEKDCKKIIQGAPDTQGSNFILPVHNTDNGFIAMLSTSGDVIGTVKIQLDVSSSLTPIEMLANETKQIYNTDITEATYSKITLTATGGEISVYLYRSTVPGKDSKGPIYPTDILGTSYHIYKHSQATLATFCDIYTIGHDAQTNAGHVLVDVNTEVQQQEYDDLGSSHLVKSDRPLAVFCGTLQTTLLQVPPVETLGKQFLIPAIDIAGLSLNASIVVITSEDSTVITIRGDYDQRDTVDMKGGIVNRILVTDTIFNITATKPVQVYLHINSTELNWTSDIHIPATAQYKKEHVFPGFVNDFINIHSSYAIDANGNSVISQITPGATSLKSSTVKYAIPTFSLSFVIFVGSSNAMIIPSDVLFQDINQVCTLTTGSPGDGIDNDCDGLIDEEHCSDSAVPGTIDYDIDGRLHEDCANGTHTTLRVLDLSIPDAMVSCKSSSGNVSVGYNDTDGGIVISGTNSTDDSADSIGPSIQGSGSAPSFEPLTVIGADINMDGLSDLPEETCRTECLCPCGWVTVPRNYTQEELDESVAEIQEKLKVKKNELSAVIRTKTSATDDRPSATAVGVVGLVFLVVVLGSIALLDFTALINDIRVLCRTIKAFITF